MQETQVWSLDWEYTIKKGMATHSSILAWRILFTEEPGGLQSMGSQRVRDDWTIKHTHTHDMYMIYVLFQIIFHYRFLQGTEYSSLCYGLYTVGLCLFYGSVYMFIPNSTPYVYPSPSLPSGNHKFFSVSVSLFLFSNFIYIMFLRFHI